MTSEIPQRCAKSSSENGAIIFTTFFGICCPPSPVESFNFSGWFVFFTISVIINIIIYFRSLIIPIFGNPWPQPSWRPEAAKCRLGSAERSGERFWRSCLGLTFGRVVVCATISEKTFGTGEGRIQEKQIWTMWQVSVQRPCAKKKNEKAKNDVRNSTGENTRKTNMDHVASKCAKTLCKKEKWKS